MFNRCVEGTGIDAIGRCCSVVDCFIGVAIELLTLDFTTSAFSLLSIEEFALEDRSVGVRTDVEDIASLEWNLSLSRALCGPTHAYSIDELNDF